MRKFQLLNVTRTTDNQRTIARLEMLGYEEVKEVKKEVAKKEVLKKGK